MSINIIKIIYELFQYLPLQTTDSELSLIDNEFIIYKYDDVEYNSSSFSSRITGFSSSEDSDRTLKAAYETYKNYTQEKIEELKILAAQISSNCHTQEMPQQKANIVYSQETVQQNIIEIDCEKIKQALQKRREQILSDADIISDSGKQQISKTNQKGKPINKIVKVNILESSDSLNNQQQLIIDRFNQINTKQYILITSDSEEVTPFIIEPKHKQETKAIQNPADEKRKAHQELVSNEVNLELPQLICNNTKQLRSKPQISTQAFESKALINQCDIESLPCIYYQQQNTQPQLACGQEIHSQSIFEYAECMVEYITKRPRFQQIVNDQLTECVIDQFEGSDLNDPRDLELDIRVQEVPEKTDKIGLAEIPRQQNIDTIKDIAHTTLIVPINIVKSKQTQNLHENCKVQIENQNQESHKSLQIEQNTTQNTHFQIELQKESITTGSTLRYKCKNICSLSENIVEYKLKCSKSQSKECNQHAQLESSTQFQDEDIEPSNISKKQRNSDSEEVTPFIIEPKHKQETKAIQNPADEKRKAHQELVSNEVNLELPQLICNNTKQLRSKPQISTQAFESKALINQCDIESLPCIYYQQQNTQPQLACGQEIHSQSIFEYAECMVEYITKRPRFQQIVNDQLTECVIDQFEGSDLNDPRDLELDIRVQEVPEKTDKIGLAEIPRQQNIDTIKDIAHTTLIVPINIVKSKQTQNLHENCKVQIENQNQESHKSLQIEQNTTQNTHFQIELQKESITTGSTLRYKCKNICSLSENIVEYKLKCSKSQSKECNQHAQLESSTQFQDEDIEPSNISKKQRNSDSEEVTPFIIEPKHKQETKAIQNPADEKRKAHQELVSNEVNQELPQLICNNTKQQRSKPQISTQAFESTKNSIKFQSELNSNHSSIQLIKCNINSNHQIKQLTFVKMIAQIYYVEHKFPVQETTQFNKKHISLLQNILQIENKLSKITPVLDQDFMMQYQTDKQKQPRNHNDELNNCPQKKAKHIKPVRKYSHQIPTSNIDFELNSTKDHNFQQYFSSKDHYNFMKEAQNYVMISQINKVEQKCQSILDQDQISHNFNGNTTQRIQQSNVQNTLKSIYQTNQVGRQDYEHTLLGNISSFVESHSRIRFK
ncbi:Hypothetical_protein [Hexamita inflata]|uniref:Hypothetical_protein n=1 Tax=Hexamita inflata TaxID=28002 RepID=A0AA86QER1_9EUKA|nr:Hypothetical protein HINF_LOCUS39427 [Hexamita inflata]